MPRKILALIPEAGSIEHYRVHLPFGRLVEEGLAELRVRSKLDDEDVEWCDTVLFQRQYHPGHLHNATALSRHYGKTIWYDIDDYVLDMHTSHPHYRAFREADEFYRAFLAVADIVSVPTDECKRLYRKAGVDGKKIAVLPNCVDLAAEKDWPRQETDGQEVRVLFQGGVAHAMDLHVLTTALFRVATDLPQVKLVFFGLPEDLVDQARRSRSLNGKLCGETPADRIEIHPATPFDIFREKMAALSCDIGLAPLGGTAFSKGKSPIKWFDYTLAGCVTVAQFQPPYRGIIRDGVDGVLASSGNDWYVAIRELVENPGLRSEILKSAQERLCEFGIENHWRKWADVLGDVRSAGLSRAPGDARGAVCCGV